MLYRFAEFDARAAATRTKTTLSANQKKLDALTTRLAAQETVHWADVMPPLYQFDNALQDFAVMSHMHDVLDNPTIRQLHEQLLPLIEKYHSGLAKHQALYQQIERIDTEQLTPIEQRQLALFKQSLQLAGAHLPSDTRQSLARLTTRLARTSAQFANNLLDATQAWSQIVDDNALAGVPNDIKAAIMNVPAENKHAHNTPRYTLTIRPDIYSAIMCHADNRALRADMHRAYNTRATAHSVAAPECDNTTAICTLLNARYKQAQLLGFDNYAAFSLHTKMAQSVNQVRAFLYQLADATRVQAQQEYHDLEAFAEQELGIDTLKPWDYNYASNKLREQRHALDQETLRQYFPLPVVLNGICTLIERLFAVKLVPQQGNGWYPDVKLYAVHNTTQDGTTDSSTIRGYIYMDLFARNHKQGGAWMNDFQNRSYIEDTLMHPVAFLVCNFLNTDQTLLYHYEVETLLHEFGHCLHHLLTTIDMPDISGINGVEWDAVELPSQLFEYWAWHEQTLPLLSAHYQTGASLPHSLITALQRSRHFHSALAITRQIEFALLDLELHAAKRHTPRTLIQVQATVYKTVAVMPHAEYEHPAHAFAHIFAGGYAAGYYSYLWADVLASNVYALFADNMLNRDMARKYYVHFLSAGGSAPAAQLFEKLCGHAPDINQFLRTRIGMHVEVRTENVDTHDSATHAIA